MLVWYPYNEAELLSCHSQIKLVIMMIDWSLRLGIKIRRLEFGDWIGIDDQDWGWRSGLRLEVGIGDWGL